jgi:hypothetical protein
MFHVLVLSSPRLIQHVSSMNLEKKEELVQSTPKIVHNQMALYFDENR